jgi:hypothetical protein
MAVSEIDWAILMLAAVAGPFGRKHKTASALRNNAKANRYLVYLIIEMGGGALTHSQGPSPAIESVMVIDLNTSWHYPLTHCGLRHSR